MDRRIVLYSYVSYVFLYGCSGEDSDRKATAGFEEEGGRAPLPSGNEESESGDAEGRDGSAGFEDLPPPKEDVAKTKDGEPDEPPDTELNYTYIWIANSHQGTVSKIDTQTLVEEGRYVTRPDGMGDPSRTSANRAGDVVVANRSGGVTKIYADASRCEDKNGNGTIETSTSSDFLTWDEEECVAWHVPMDYDSQRAIAWTQGEQDETTLEVTGEKVWVTGVSEGSNMIDIMLLDGDTGVIEHMVQFDYGPYVAPFIGQPASPWGAYGGAVDRQDNFWLTDLKRDDLNERPLIRVSFEDFSMDVWRKPSNSFSYGMTVDAYGRAWVCHQSVLRFDPETEIWDRAAGNLGLPNVDSTMASGCMMDAEARLWTSAVMKNDEDGDGSKDGIAAIDAHTLEGIVAYELPEHPHGVSIDFDGFIWGVSAGTGAEFGMGGDKAFRLDPVNGSFETFEGLVGAYTYSDMTGFALSAVIEEPPPEPPPPD